MTAIMKPLRSLRPLLAVGLATVLARCSGSTDPGPDDVRPPGQLNILRLPANHPPFFNDSASFYAKVGRSDEGKLYFQEPDGARGEAFAELKIDSQTLLARPDGSPLGPNDSVLIVLKVVDQDEILVELSPTGLRFNSNKPAELKLDYEETGGDLDGDGDSDDDDADIEMELSIWRQETPADDFVKIGTVKVEDQREFKAFLTSFSRYALAY
jgi:hypothetical protein